MTAEEYIVKRLEEQEKLNQELALQHLEQQQKINRLECIVDTLKEHAKFDGEYITIMVGGYDALKDRNWLVKELELKKEENE